MEFDQPNVDPACANQFDEVHAMPQFLQSRVQWSIGTDGQTLSLRDPLRHISMWLAKAAVTTTPPAAASAIALIGRWVVVYATGPASDIAQTSQYLTFTDAGNGRGGLTTDGCDTGSHPGTFANAPGTP